MKYVTCKKCGWVHFEVSLNFALSEIEKFEAYFQSLPEKERHEFYGNRSSSLRDYDRCGQCGGSYETFRDARPGDCPDGCTIGPVLERGKK